MAKIFISYRREDSQYQADKLHGALKPYVANPKADIFIDIDNIPFGVDFATHLDGKVAQCEVLLALIGHGWAQARDDRGQRRLDDPEDFVRIEIASALKRGIPVVPVLLDGAPVPKAEDLPDELKPLARRNALPVTRASFEADVARLVNGLPIDLPGKRLRETASPTRKKMPGVIALLSALTFVAGAWMVLARVPENSRTPQRINTTASNEDEKPASIAIAPKYRPGMEFQDKLLAVGGDGPTMVIVPAGSFLMGSAESEVGRERDEGPQHTVTFARPFAIGKYEVTWSEYQACVSDGGCAESEHSPPYQKERNKKERRPVDGLSWNDAKAYAAWLSRRTGYAYRLPTEAEWEYAARAGTIGRFHNNGDEVALCRIANGADASITDDDRRNPQCNDGFGRGATAPVGSFASNAFGLHDMHGNVAEWVDDCYQSSYAGAPTDGSARTDCTTYAILHRVVRGGSWVSEPQFMRSAGRHGVQPWLRLTGPGFRVAKTLE